MRVDRHRRHFKREEPQHDMRRCRGEHEEGRRLGRGGGAKTFRRARALTFLQKLQVQRDMLKKQLGTPELQAINPMIAGELKAVEMMMAEFIVTFELQEAFSLLDNENGSQLEGGRKGDQ